MSKRKSIDLECGPFTVSKNAFNKRDWDNIMQQLRRVKELCYRFLNFDARITLYEGSNDFKLSGGRVTNLSISDILNLIEASNNAGNSFALALNRYFEIDGDLKLNNNEYYNDLKALEHLANIGEKFGRKNLVIISLEELREQIVDLFDGTLLTIGSCVQFTSENDQVARRKLYLEALKKFDYVVPLNQDNNPIFLESLKNYRNKIICFLDSPCGSKNLRECRNHYQLIEQEIDRNGERTPLAKCVLGSAPSEFETHYSLMSRRNDLYEILCNIGINKLKMERKQKLLISAPSEFAKENKLFLIFSFLRSVMSQITI